ncbi:MAG: 3-hydroxybutyrate dehydrogenase [Acidimicrobiales bacterium]
MLQGRSALVTGSTSGIGLAIARSLAHEGANVMLNGFGDRDVVEALRASLAEEHGVDVAYDDADLTRAGEATALVERTQSRWGSLDVLVNNAGVQHVAPLDEFPIERWDAIIALNLSAVFLTMRAAIPAMRSQGWGRIINIDSAHGLVASPYKVAYVAAKHGVLGATKVAALELANDGVTVNAICPGWVRTPLVEQQLEDRARDAGTDVAHEATRLLSEKQPMLTFTAPESIGALAVFLCADHAATITGSALSIDGGWVAQ